MPEDTNVFGAVGDTEIEGEAQTTSPVENKPEGQEGQAQDLNIPFHQHPRWKEIYEKASRVENLEKELANLRTQVGQTRPENKEWEPKTWPEVIQKAKEEVLSQLQQAQQAEQGRITAEDQALSNALVQLKDQVGEFDEQKLLQFCYAHKIGDIAVGYELMKKIDTAEKTGEKHALRKKAAPIGSSAKTEGGAKQSTPYQSLHKRSLEDIVSDAAGRIS